MKVIANHAMHDEPVAIPLSDAGASPRQIQAVQVTKIRKLPTLLRGMEARPPELLPDLVQAFLQHADPQGHSRLWGYRLVPPRQCLPARPHTDLPFGVVNATHVLSMFAPGVGGGHHRLPGPAELDGAPMLRTSDSGDEAQRLPGRHRTRSY
jgi:hypothetical protein